MAPGSAATTRSPTAKLVAPQIINLVAPSPQSRPTYRIGFLLPDNSSIVSTLATTKGPVKSLP
ncbi:unannotated protein [freshwater metagenome]|uniref:Unannotated protein n=1 Tax=freshwater metagenome TaxID=449393 RepID=A0A6J6BZD7_9ZZZZ